MTAELHFDVFFRMCGLRREGKVAQSLVRRLAAEEKVLDVRIRALGGAESDNLTFLGKLLSGRLDNGRGSAHMQ